MNAVSKRRSRVLNWNPAFELNGSHLCENDLIYNFESGRAGYVVNAVEQALLLLKDMDELWNLKKHELFLSVKRDLALVRFPYTYFSTSKTSLLQSRPLYAYFPTNFYLKIGRASCRERVW